jgi:hypothetical protein
VIQQRHQCLGPMLLVWLQQATAELCAVQQQRPMCGVAQVKHGCVSATMLLHDRGPASQDQQVCVRDLHSCELGREVCEDLAQVLVQPALLQLLVYLCCELCGL